MEPFTVCSGCKKVWADRNSFLGDLTVRITGYNINLDYLDNGYFIFLHEDCKTSSAIEVSFFKDLYQGKENLENKMGSSECPGYCKNNENLNDCNVLCECNYVRKILTKIVKRIKD
jgi:hypothetical protein